MLTLGGVMGLGVTIGVLLDRLASRWTKPGDAPRDVAEAPADPSSPS